jgi:hypothetical protein
MSDETPKMRPVCNPKNPRKERRRTTRVRMIRASTEDLQKKVDPNAPTLHEVHFDMEEIAAAVRQPPDPNASPEFPPTPMIKALPQKPQASDEKEEPGATGAEKAGWGLLRRIRRARVVPGIFAQCRASPCCR